MDEILTGGVRTYSAESALATGNKSNDKFVVVLPAEVTSPGVDQSLADRAYKPVATQLDKSKSF
ncbi:hypothetical protein E2R53_20380 [Peribacillus frigoritolerans]|nr:hypothetical protein E2R53_20380 [Peribacillus frigoritolerans]